MDDLRYEAPGTLEAAVALLASEKGEARVMAGGTDVLVLLHGDIIEPDLLVDIKNIPELNGITQENGGWRVGAATNCMDIVDHQEFSAAWPGVVDGVKLIGSIQVKGRERFIPATAQRGDDRFDVGSKVVVVGFNNGTVEVVSEKEHEFVNQS